MGNFPSLGVTQVMSRSLNPWGVYVLHPTIQATGVLVQMGLSGSADALRVSQKALPTEGTWGLVAWPHGDSRNGIWICSLFTQGNSALLTSSADVDYEAHPSGAWSLLDQNGQATLSLPDGSFITFGNGGNKPELTRQVVNSAQQTVTQSYPDSTRQAGTPSPFPFTFSLASGANIKVDTSANIILTTIGTLTANVTGNVEVTTQNNVTITVGSGMMATINGNTTINGILYVDDEIYAKYGSADQVGVTTHTHTQGPDSHGDTEEATSAPTAGT